MSAVKNTTALSTKLYPQISKLLSTKTTAFKNVVGRYINSHNKELYDIAPFDRIPFLRDDVDDFYHSIGRDLEKLATEAIKNTYYAPISNFNPKYAKDEFTVCILMCIRYFAIKKDTKNLELAALYLAFSGKFYPSVHYGSFPTAEPSQYRHVMEYVVNHELTMKYDIISQGNVIGAIRSICKTWLETYKDLIKSPEDEDMVYIVQQLRDRIKSFMINIATVYYEVYNRKGQYLTYDSDNASEDDFRVADSNSLIAQRWVESTMSYITTHDVNFKFCKMVSDSNVGTDEISLIIQSIQQQQENIPLIRELIGLIIYIYMNNPNTKDKDVRSLEFVSKSIAAKPGAKNKDLIRQKAIIESWLSENSPQYRKRRSREATKNSYHKAILSYYVLVINNSCK